MPSFDAVSEVDQVEVRNAVDQSNKEINNRFDFKGSDSRIEAGEAVLTLFADDEFKLNQVFDILTAKFAKRNVDTRCLEREAIQKISGNKAKQEVKLKIGIETARAKEIIKLIKEAKLKVQASIQGDSVRVTGNKRDDLQQVIALLKKEITDLPLQFINFRD